MKHIMVAMTLGALLVGCGGGKDCVDLCTEAQAGQCTSITGSCTSFCNALDAVQGPANCESQRNAYEACLDDGDAVCSNSCGATESSLSSCVGTYCLANSSNPNCQTLLQSF